MKKLSLFLTVLSFLFVSCSQSDHDFSFDSDSTSQATSSDQLNARSIFDDVDYTAPEGFDKNYSFVSYGELQYVSYYSTTTASVRKAMVVLPPNYNPGEKYPVLYLLHGISGSEFDWLYGSANEVVNNLVVLGKAKKMILVLPNIEVVHSSITTPLVPHSIEHYQAYNNFLNDLRDDLMPFIEKTFSVLPGRENRAVAGLSMGGRSAIHVGINLISSFGYIGAFTPAVGVLPYDREGGLFTGETLTLPDMYKNNTMMMIVKGNEDGVVGDWPIIYSYVLRGNGVNHIYYSMPGGHDFTVWKNGLYNFARRIFK